MKENKPILRNNAENLMERFDSVESCLDAFQQNFQNGILNIKKACVAYVYALDNFDGARQFFIDKCPGVPPRVWDSMQAVGRNWIDQRLLWGGGRASNRMKRLPLSIQSEILDNGIDVLLSSNEVVHLSCDDIMTEQIEQVFASNHVRTIAEQRCYMQTVRSQRPVEAKDSKSWEVTSHKLVVHVAPISFTKKEIRQILKLL